MANAVVHFEIPADDVARATTFYEKTFGWTIKAFPMPPGEEYYSVVTRKKGAPGIDGGLMKRKMADQPFTNYINVPSIDDMNCRPSRPTAARHRCRSRRSARTWAGSRSSTIPRTT